MRRSLLLLLASLAVLGAACAVVGDPQSPRFVAPEPDAAQGEVVLEVEARPDAGPLTFTVSFDGRSVPLSGRAQTFAVPAGALFVDVTASREVDPGLLSDELVPQRQLVPCGRGRVCERTALVPRRDVSALAPPGDEVVCRRGAELVIVEGATHRVHVSADASGVCRVACTRLDAARGIEEDCAVDGP